MTDLFNAGPRQNIVELVQEKLLPDRPQELLDLVSFVPLLGHCNNTRTPIVKEKTWQGHMIKWQRERERERRLYMLRPAWL